MGPLDLVPLLNLGSLLGLIDNLFLMIILVFKPSWHSGSSAQVHLIAAGHKPNKSLIRWRALNWPWNWEIYVRRQGAGQLRPCCPQGSTNRQVLWSIGPNRTEIWKFWDQLVLVRGSLVIHVHVDLVKLDHDLENDIHSKDHKNKFKIRIGDHNGFFDHNLTTVWPRSFDPFFGFWFVGFWLVELTWKSLYIAMKPSQMP